MGRRALPDREQLSRMLHGLAPEQAGALVQGIISLLGVVALDIVLAVVPPRCVRKRWRERRPGPAKALQYYSPGL